MPKKQDVVTCPSCQKELTPEPALDAEGAQVFKCSCKGKPREVVKIYPRLSESISTPSTNGGA